MGITGTFEGSASNPFYLINNGIIDTTYGTQIVQYSSTQFSTKIEVRYSMLQISAHNNDDYNAGYVIIRLSKAFSLTQYSTIHAQVTSGRYDESKIGVSSNGSLTSASFNTSVNIIKGLQDGIITFSVSSLSGTYYIYAYIKVAAYREGYLYIRNFYFT